MAAIIFSGLHLKSLFIFLTVSPRIFSTLPLQPEWTADTTDADIQSLGAVAKSLEQSVKNLDKRNDWLDPKVLAGLIVGLIAARPCCSVWLAR